jgi:hypothetical protein
MEPRFLTSARDIINHLSERVVIAGPDVQAAVASVVFYETRGTMESFCLIDQYPRVIHRLRRAADRYKNQIDKVGFTFFVNEDLTDHTYSRVTMEDGTVCAIPMPFPLGRHVTFYAPYASPSDPLAVSNTLPSTTAPCTPTSYVATVTDLTTAIDKADLRSVQEIIMSGVDANAQGRDGPAMIRAMTVASQGPSAQTFTVVDWLARRVEWYEVYSPIQRTTLLMAALKIDMQTLNRLPWADINVHHQDADGNTIMHLCPRCPLGATGHVDVVDVMERIEMLLHRGSGTLALTINHKGQRPRDMWTNPHAVDRLWQVEQDTATALRAYMTAHIPVPDLVAIVTGFIFGSL